MIRRSGVTLIEVLIAIFVVALGLLALLTLFPLGALSMGQSIRDDRIALTAANAVATLKIMDAASDKGVLDAMVQGDSSNSNFPVDSPTNAAFFDPIGVYAYPPPNNIWVGGVNGGVGRTSLTSNNFPGVNPLQPAFIHGWFTSLDDMTFTRDDVVNGTPQQSAVPADQQGMQASIGGAGPPQRDGRYSWGAMLRRPQWGKPVTEVSIVVYSGRSTWPSVNPNLTPAGETPLQVTAVSTNVVPNVVTVSYPGAAPDIRPGAWILDATPQPGHGYFYRVTGVPANGNGTADLELETPLRANPTVVVLMDYVAEVIEKGVIAP